MRTVYSIYILHEERWQVEIRYKHWYIQQIQKYDMEWNINSRLVKHKYID